MSRARAKPKPKRDIVDVGTHAFWSRLRTCSNQVAPTTSWARGRTAGLVQPVLGFPWPVAGERVHACHCLWRCGWSHPIPVPRGVCQEPCAAFCAWAEATVLAWAGRRGAEGAGPVACPGMQGPSCWLKLAPSLWDVLAGGDREGCGLLAVGQTCCAASHLGIRRSQGGPQRVACPVAGSLHRG